MGRVAEAHEQEHTFHAILVLPLVGLAWLVVWLIRGSNTKREQRSIERANAEWERMTKWRSK